MKTRKNFKNRKSSLSFLFLMSLFLFFSLSFVSSTTWLDYGCNQQYIKNSQVSTIKGNFDSGIDKIISSYGQSYENDDVSQPLIAYLNNEQFIAVQDGLYLRLLDKDLNLNSELFLSDNPIGQMSIADFNKDGRVDIIRAMRYNSTAINISVFDIASDWTLSLQTSILYTAEGDEMDITGFRCKETGDTFTRCFSGLTFNNSDGCNLYVMEMYENSGNINIAPYSLENNASSCSFRDQISFIEFNDGDSYTEFLAYTDTDVYLIDDGLNTEFTKSFAGKSDVNDYDYPEKARIVNTPDGFKVVVAVSGHDSSDSSVVTGRLILYDVNGNQDDISYLGEYQNRVRITGLAVADYDGNGYDDLFLIKSVDSGTDFQNIEIYRGRDFESLYTWTFDSGSYGLGSSVFDKGDVILGKMTTEDNFNLLHYSPSDLTLYNLENESEIYYNSSDNDYDCSIGDVTGSNLNDIYCVKSSDSFALTPETDTIINNPTLDESLPDLRIPYDYTKDLSLDDYFSDYSTINLTTLNETISIDLDSGGTTDSISNENITISLLDFSSYIRLTVNSKDNNYTLTGIEVKAINEAGEITDSFNVYIDDSYLETELPEGEEENVLLNIVVSFAEMFPDSEDLSTILKIGTVLLVMIIIAGIMILGTSSLDGGISSGALYLTAFFEFMAFVFFIAIGYIGIGVLILMFLLLMAIAYFKFFKGDN